MLSDYENKIINADCLDVLKKFPDKCIDLVLTDPPYQMSALGGDMSKKRKIYEEMAKYTNTKVSWFTDEFIDLLVSKCVYPKFFVETWLKNKSYKYFEERDSSALPYLEKLLSLPNYREVMGYIEFEKKELSPFDNAIKKASNFDLKE